MFRNFNLLGMVKQAHIGDASKNTLSSYAYIIMLIHYLQKVEVLPYLQEIRKIDESHKSEMINGYETWFQEDLEFIRESFSTTNNDSLSSLWLGFLQFYEKFDYDKNCIQIRRPGNIPVSGKPEWEEKLMYIEDPFELSHNLARGVISETKIKILEIFTRYLDLWDSQFLFFQVQDYTQHLIKQHGRSSKIKFAPDSEEEMVFKKESKMEKIIWWKEAKIIERQVDIDQNAENFMRILEKIENSSMNRNCKIGCQKGLLKALCDEMNSRFSKKGQFLDIETIEKLQASLERNVISTFTYDIPETLTCEKTDILLEEKYTFIKNYMRKYLKIMAQMISLSQNGQKDLMNDEKVEIIKDFDDGNHCFEELLRKNNFGIIIDFPGFIKILVERHFSSQEISEKETLARLSNINGETKEAYFLRLALDSLEKIIAERKKSGSTNEKILFIGLKSWCCNDLVQKLMADFSENGYEFEKFSAVEFQVEFKNKITGSKNIDEKFRRKKEVTKISMENFYVLLAAVSSENALMVTQDGFHNMFPANLKRGNMIFSILMATGNVKKAQAQEIADLRYD